MCAFIIKKNIHGKEYYYLRESKRIDGKVKSVCLAYLGKTKKDAEKKAEEILKAGKKIEKKEIKKKIEKFKLQYQKISIEDLATFCKRKGFVYQSGEIYGGFAGFWDFGHIGVELKNNIKKEWWKSHVTEREDIIGIDGSIITHPKVWEASGHVDSFNDVLAICKKCKKPNKFDKFELDKAVCQFCGGEVDKKNAKSLGMMMKTQIGPDPNTAVLSYLRPETAQLIFINFKDIVENARMKLPFGIAQIGKAFRNEIAPRDFLFRTREFEQMELQYFVDLNKINDCPYYDKIKNYKIEILTAVAQEKEEKACALTINEMLNKEVFKNKWHAYWLYKSYKWFLELGIDKKKMRLREHKKDELSHYADSAIDIEYEFSFGWQEIFGSHDRTDYDLSQHEKFSKKDLKIFDEETKKKILPRVIESSFGVERAFLIFMFDSYFKNQKDEIVLRLPSRLAPIKAAIFPIVKINREIVKISKAVYEDLKKEFNVFYDVGGSIGKRYARNDEIGTPFCITIDEKSLKKNDVTIRDRDTTKQIRVKISDLKKILRKLIEKEIDFDKAGEKFF